MCRNDSFSSEIYLGLDTTLATNNKNTSRQPFSNHWIGLRENLQESPIFNGKNDGFL
jgi:hypothetical protein